MKPSRPFFPILLFLGLLLAACAPQPEVIIVEITRLVPEIQQVEVTRLVEVEKEVTRIVEVPSLDPGTAVSTPDLQQLLVEFWPDFDQPSVHVLLTGSLPPGHPLPAELFIPIPSDAQINAVAQIDEAGMAAIDYQPLEDAVLFQSDTAAFRVEYYVPYEQEENQRAYAFQWLAPFTVDELAVQIVEVFVEGADAGLLGLDPSHTGKQFLENIGHFPTLLFPSPMPFSPLFLYGTLL
jgi:hypothetical protein